MQKIISGLATIFPKLYIKALLGSPLQSSRLAHFIHYILNILPVKRFPVLPCGGLLKGYRMKIDWRRHRSYIYGTWEPEVVNAISRVVSEGNVAIDIGSHIGFYALLLSKLVGQSGAVIAFEPLPGNFRIIQENIHLNQLYSRVIAVNKAVLDRSLDEVRLTVPIDESSSLTSSPWASVFKDSGDTVIVKAVSLDDFLNEIKLPVHFIKMDVEGAEELVVRGALKAIELHHPTMLIELHHPDSRGEDHPIIPLLNGLNYEIEWLDRLHPTSHILAKWNGKSHNNE